MSDIKSYKGILQAFQSKHENIKKYFEYVQSLVQDYPFDICLSYQFARLELAQNWILYYGCTKIHKTESELTSKAIANWHITRPGFSEKFKIIFGKDIPNSAIKRIDKAYEVRDNIMHGKETSQSTMRQAIVDILEYSDQLDTFIYSVAKFRPFGDMRGYKGGSGSLDKSTTRWVLKGMGFDLS